MNDFLIFLSILVFQIIVTFIFLFLFLSNTAFIAPNALKVKYPFLIIFSFELLLFLFVQLVAPLYNYSFSINHYLNFILLFQNLISSWNTYRPRSHTCLKFISLNHSLYFLFLSVSLFFLVFLISVYNVFI